MTPKLRFPQFKDDLNSTKFANSANKTVKHSITGGPFGSDLKSADYTEKGVRIIQLQNIGDGIFNDKSKIYTSIEKADMLSACNIYAGEIILSKMGDPVARACKMPLEDLRYLMSSDGIRYVPDESVVDKEFIFQYINSSRFRKQAEAVSTGSTRKRIGLGDLKKIDIRFPSLAEQRKISGLLLSLDQKINLLTKKKEALETYKKGLMQKIFSQELRFKRDDGTDYPEWLKCSLGDVGDLKNGYAFKSDSYIEEGYYSIVTIKNVQNGKLINGFNCISELPKNIKKHHLLQIDDLLISMTGNVGRVCLVKQTNLLLNQRVGLIAIIDEMDKKLCFYQLQQNSMLNYFITNGEGAAQPNISKDVILNAQLRIPTDKEEKIKIVHFFSMIDNLIDNVQESLESAVKLKSGLLQQMFV